ncbi:DNA repair protein complementing XP-C cells-like [Argopecten irradians]|uniref:DNA repair protein complementing XP-C cells-like n=1 Tax=Argopecten irradians TaxID=31199 RepID=UPI003716439A
MKCEIKDEQDEICNDSEPGKTVSQCEDNISVLAYSNPLGRVQSENNNIQNMSGFDIDYMSSCSSDESELEEESKKLSSCSIVCNANLTNGSINVDKTSGESKSIKTEKDTLSTPKALLVQESTVLSSDEDFEASNATNKSRSSRKRKGDSKKNVKVEPNEKKSKATTTTRGKPRKSVKSGKNKKTIPDQEKNEDVTERQQKDTDKVKMEVRKNPFKHLDESDVASVLMLMEGVKKGENSEVGPSGSVDMSDQESLMESSEDEGWEDVKDHQSPKKNRLPEEGVEITIDAPELFKKRKKKQFDWKQYVQRQINRFQKGVREDIHKVHLLCLLVRGMYLNNLCNCPQLTAQAISIAPKEFSSRCPENITMATLSRMVQWFKSLISITDGQSETEQMECALQNDFEEKKANNMLEFVLLFVILLRSLGLDIRLVMSLQPVSAKPVKDDAKTKKSPKGKLPNSTTKSSKSKQTQIDKDSSSQTTKVPQKKDAKSAKSKTSKYFKNSDSKTKAVKLTGKNKAKKEDEDQKCDSEGGLEKYKVKNRRLRTRGSKVKPSSYNQGSGDESEEESDDSFIPVSDNEDCKSKKQGEKRKSTQSQKSRKSKHSQKVKVEDTESQSSENESDFEPSLTQFRSPLKTKKPLKNNRKVLSSDSDTSSNGTSRVGCDQWAEVYLETEHKWICVNFVKGELNAPYAIESHATQPVHYVVGYNNKGYVKDVTARYAANWLTETRKLRVDPDWIEETYAPYLDPDTEAMEQEDTHIKDNLIRRPMPTSVGAFKGHPLYALKRHLLKFEAIYPNSAVPLGFIRGEPVYARDCVHVLHSRENWLKEGRAVRLGEESYKMVKSRPKWNKPKENPDALDLELFGEWQTEVYIPPPAVDGKVPRNEYGNVELFKPSMLPAGTVHLKVPGLNKVAKKMGLDCVPAMMGWDTHCGYSHPILEGFVVCEEHKDILLTAWDEDQEIQRQKEAEKKEKRVIANWKLLTKGLLIKDKLKSRFDLQTETSSQSHLEKCEDPEAIKAEDFEKSWPRNREPKKKKKKKYDETEVI